MKTVETKNIELVQLSMPGREEADCGRAKSDTLQLLRK